MHCLNSGIFAIFIVHLKIKIYETFFTFCSHYFSCSNVSGNDTLRYFIKSKPISELNEPYIEANLCRKPFSNKYFIDIDYGQETAIFTLRKEGYLINLEIILNSQAGWPL